MMLMAVDLSIKKKPEFSSKMLLKVSERVINTQMKSSSRPLTTSTQMDLVPSRKLRWLRSSRDSHEQYKIDAMKNNLDDITVDITFLAC